MLKLGVYTGTSHFRCLWSPQNTSTITVARLVFGFTFICVFYNIFALTILDHFPFKLVQFLSDCRHVQFNTNKGLLQIPWWYSGIPIVDDFPYDRFIKWKKSFKPRTKDSCAFYYSLLQSRYLKKSLQFLFNASPFLITLNSGVVVLKRSTWIRVCVWNPGKHWSSPHLRCGHTWGSTLQLGWTGSDPPNRWAGGRGERCRWRSPWSKHTLNRARDSTGCHAVGTREAKRWDIYWEEYKKRGDKRGRKRGRGMRKAVLSSEDLISL